MKDGTGIKLRTRSRPIRDDRTVRTLDNAYSTMGKFFELYLGPDASIDAQHQGATP